MRSRLAGLAIGVAALSASASAGAYCRTTTCNSSDPANPCSSDADGCLVGGKPLYWPGACVSFSVQKDGSPLRHITAQDAEKTIATGFAQWVGAECADGSHPSIKISDRGLVSCDKQEYSSTDGNANIWMFRDDAWPYDDGAGDTLALTTVTYNKLTGEIFDADVEFNSVQNELVNRDTPPYGCDLLSIATHEAGHFVGLAHNVQLASATMNPGYTCGTIGLRTLDPDDVAGVCAIYPTGRAAAACNDTPRHGYSTVCASPDTKGCSCGAVPRPGHLGWVALGLGALATALARRRRPAPH